MNNNKVYLGSPENANTAAVVCYFTFIGWLIAYFAIYKNEKTSLASFHLRQTLLLYILLFAVNIPGYWMPQGLIALLDITWFLLWLWGFFNAINDHEYPLPLIGKWAQKLFKGI